MSFVFPSCTTKYSVLCPFAAALGGLVDSMLATGPTVVGSGLAEDGGFLWVINICSVHFLQTGSKAISPML
jgi:hypothetical protein